MNTESVREYCLAKENAAESMPFGDSVLVFKTHGKIFLLLSLDTSPMQFNVKCDPDHARELREQYAAVQPGYHMNKKHWNTVIADGTLTDRQLKEFIDESYRLVTPATKKKKTA